MKVSSRPLSAITSAFTLVVIFSMVIFQVSADDYTKSIALHIDRVMHDNGVITHHVVREMRRWVTHIDDEPHTHIRPALFVKFNSVYCSDNSCSRCS